ncbi:acyl-CoA thioesterase [Gordonia humi]|uniref:Acyl-CoA thioesterase-2 n=1 Tax=Gordonia humi TaxID=686429 RepID=A0A840EM65_9ACTN|nr:acyl-CoA thioesterase domain-containing protein [Gordonia humi]MBB4133865.1 acyl-CoA thioesterase-2 [Gordonia humi]
MATSDAASGPAERCASPSFEDVSAIDRIGRASFRSTYVAPTGGALYGGQVMAQALVACGATVAADRVPHSLHGYFLRRGSSAEPVDIWVDTDSDGRSYSARRATVRQRGETISTMSVSFRTDVRGEEFGPDPVVSVVPLEACRTLTTEPTIAMDVRVYEWSARDNSFPTRFWARPAVPLVRDDPLMHAAAIAYLSDYSTGLVRRIGHEDLGPSLDHAIWFHEVPQWNDWIFVDLSPGLVRRRRGWYSGSIVADGSIVANLAQEMAYHERR